MKKITIADVAKKAGVSTTTVSFVLNNKSGVTISEETRQNVLKAVQELQYFHSAAKKKTLKQIGVVVQNIVSPVLTQELSAIVRAATQNGYGVLVDNTDRRLDRESSCIDHMLKQNVKGIIITFTPFDHQYIAEVDQSTPVVVIGESNPQYNLQTVSVDSYKSGEIAVSHLYNLGHRKIAFLSHSMEGVSKTRQRRLEGVQSFLDGQRDAPSLYIGQGERVIGGDNDSNDIQTGYQLARELLQSGRDVTAIIGSGDLLTMGVYYALNEAGVSIPQDMSVISMDNIYVANWLYPRLTSVGYHFDERGQLAFMQLLNRIERQGSLRTVSHLVEYSPTLIVRDSTCPAR